MFVLFCLGFFVSFYFIYLFIYFCWGIYLRFCWFVSLGFTFFVYSLVGFVFLTPLRRPKMPATEEGGQLLIPVFGAIFGGFSI